MYVEDYIIRIAICNKNDMMKMFQGEPSYDTVAKMTYLEMCLTETLRMYPVVAM